MTEEIHLTSRSALSGRTAVIAEERDSVWLYLCPPDQDRPETACWILNTSHAPAEPDRTVYRALSSPPPVPARYAAPSAPDPHRGHWRLLWAEDDSAVAALLDDQAMAFVVAGQPRGHARYVLEGAQPWALPWDQLRFDAHFDQR